MKRARKLVFSSKTKWEGVKRCACPCKKGAPKSACGLRGLRRGVACPCGPSSLRGLRGTVAEHRQRAELFIGIAQKELARGDCFEALQTASYAVAEADWLPRGGRDMAPGTMRRRADQVRRRAQACLGR